MVDKKPKEQRNVTPYFALKDADKAIEFYKEVFGATEKFRMDGPDGKLMHAQLDIGDSSIMLTEKRDSMQMGGPTRGNTYVYVNDTDAAFKKAKDLGAKVVMEPADMFYGDRTACFIDPFDQVWTVGVHVEDVSDEEIRKRGKEMFSKKAA